MYEVKNLSKSYGKKGTLVHAVRDVSFNVNQGEIVFIMGPSGSGKTTLLSMLGLLLTPTHGSIIFNGANISALPKKYYSNIRLKNIGFVFQNFQLLPFLNVVENVEIVLNLAGTRGNAARHRAFELIDKLGLSKKATKFPEELSGGEQQRVSIARAMANDPEVILADEPTANLDAANGKTVITLLKDVVKEHNKSLVLITHDPRIEWIAEKIYVMEDGILRS